MTEDLKPTRADAVAAWYDTGAVETYRALCGDYWAEGLQRLIPNHMHDGVVRWIVLGQKPGGFLTAVLENDLKAAVTRADGINKDRLADYVGFFYQYSPMHCFGSPAAVREWKGILPEEPSA